MAQQTCGTCKQNVYANDKPQTISGGVFHASCFKCSKCSTALTLKTANLFEGALYCAPHKPYVPPTPTDIPPDWIG
jgi:cysteine and glycine-rich protein